MSLKTVEMDGVKILYDREKTQSYRTDFNKPCDCQNCRNYYKHIENNPDLIAFLNSFGIDYNCAEDVFSWDWGERRESLIHHEGYYAVFGNIDGEGFDFEKFGVKIAFQNTASVPCDKTGEYFFINIEGDYPYILEEERDFPKGYGKAGIINKIKAVFNKK